MNTMKLPSTILLEPDGTRPRLNEQVRLLLTANGLAAANGELPSEVLGVLAQFREQSRLLRDHRCPVDERIEKFLAHYFPKLTSRLRLPDATVMLDRAGLARELSLPENGDEFSNELLTSFRVRNGVLNNPKSDRRTTAGTFHVAEGGLPVPQDKKSVPAAVFAEMFRHAVNPPTEDLVLPFTANSAEPAHAFVSLLIRPIVCPAVPTYTPQKTMEIRFFAPGSLVSNLDFVESIFGNAGNPLLPENDAALDVEHWTGHTGCVILAPHLTKLTKKQLGLPHVDGASPRQKRDKMCWKDESELYNDGVAFKLTCRDNTGTIVTLIADNYYGYCKKEVKTQISFAANLFGNVEEEHAGGALAYAGWNFGDDFSMDYRRTNNRRFEDIVRDYGDRMDVQPSGYAIDKNFPNLVYVPEDSRASVRTQQIAWNLSNGEEQRITMEPGKHYLMPSGLKLRLEKHPGAPSWRIIGTRGQGIFCHKPCTVSGGGKSEISKSLRDYMIYGPIFTSDYDADMAKVEEVFKHNYANRWKNGVASRSRPILAAERSLGSVIKLLTPSEEYSGAYNDWLASIPSHIYPIVFIIKRFYRAEWGWNWRKYFTVDKVNGAPGKELKFGERKLVGTYLRVGLTEEGSWRTFKLRQDFAVASKVQTEDDISASIVVPAKAVPQLSSEDGRSFKFALNCEYRLFQRPDDAIHRGLDKQTEIDFARQDNFISNFEPLTVEQAREIVTKVTEFDQFTPPMKQLMSDAAAQKDGYVVCSSEPRIVDGKPTKNPRYLQVRPDLIDPIGPYLAEMGQRFFDATPADKPVLMPIDAVMVGRRNNPEDKPASIRGLAVYNPIHYQETPELFMDFICSLTGKSPSTTGAGSEGALTKAPFNALRPTIDLNAALVSYILTGLPGFSSSAGFVGPNFQVDHDISLLIPEIFCRLSAQERDPRFLIDNGFFEPLTDFEHGGQTILASRLGYRMTSKFVRTYLGRIFDNPGLTFDEKILEPELQDRDAFADGILNITEAQQRVAKGYFEDGSIDDAAPPLKVLLHIMAEGHYQGKDAHDPSIRAMFTRDSLLASDWYQARLAAKQKVDISLWRRHLANLDGFLAAGGKDGVANRLALPLRRSLAASELARVSHPGYLEALVGCLGTDPAVVT